jgi:dienelactone hydrolase
VVGALVVPLTGDARGGVTALTLDVLPVRSLFDAPIKVTVGGATPGQRVVLRVRSRDAKGVVWTSSSTYIADRAGQVVVERSAPVSGSYSGVEAMGPFEAMTPAGSHPQGSFYRWGSGSSESFSVSAAVGRRVVGPRTVERSATVKGETMSVESLSAEGFVGEFFQPPARAGAKHAAVLIFGGSEGGLGPSWTLAASLLAAHGYPTLALAYFKEPGLPQTLANIPLEYFTRALAWLAAQPNVNPERIFVSGASRGSEAALLLGSDFPNLVYGVIANVPSNVVYGCFGCYTSGAAWTLDGKPIPFARLLGGTNPTNAPRAVIEVEKIRGPLFLDCGGGDRLWPSCPQAHAVAAGLQNFRRRNPLTLLDYPDAGHGVGALVPYEPFTAGTNVALMAIGGDTATANWRADADLWPHLLAFLQRYG